MGKIPKKGLNKHAIVMKEKKLIEKNYDCFKCKVNHKRLKCNGVIKPTDHSIEYEIEIKYNPPNKPLVKVINPQIEYSDDIHMYHNNNSLCLYYPGDMIWSTNFNIYNTIIPWTAEWLIFYELYQITGKWKHPEVKHKKITDNYS